MSAVAARALNRYLLAQRHAQAAERALSRRHEALRRAVTQLGVAIDVFPHDPRTLTLSATLGPRCVHVEKFGVGRYALVGIITIKEKRR